MASSFSVATNDVIMSPDPYNINYLKLPTSLITDASAKNVTAAMS